MAISSRDLKYELLGKTGHSDRRRPAAVWSPYGRGHITLAARPARTSAYHAGTYFTVRARSPRRTSSVPIPCIFPHRKITITDGFITLPRPPPAATSSSISASLRFSEFPAPGSGFSVFTEPPLFPPNALTFPVRLLARQRNSINTYIYIHTI